MHQELIAVVMPGGALQLEWHPASKPLDADTRHLQKDIYGRFAADPHDSLFFLGFSDLRIPLSPSLDFWRGISAAFIRKLSRHPDLETDRQAAGAALDASEVQRFLLQAPMMTGSEYLSESLLEAVWEGLNSAFSDAIAVYDGTVADFFRQYNPDVHLAGRVYFHLVENKDGEYPFAFLATYSTRIDAKGKSRHLPLKHALAEYGKNSETLLELLRTVYLAAKESAFISVLLDGGELFHPMGWTPHEAYTFLKEVPVYEQSGVLCRIPNWWKPGASGVRLNVSIGDKQPSYVGMDALLDFRPRLFLGDVEITASEARRLLEESAGLAFIKNRWVAADPEKLKKTLDAYEKACALMDEEGISIREAMRMQLNPERFFDEAADAEIVSISNGQWMRETLEKLVRPERIADVAPPPEFKAMLRPYQQKGLNWFWFLRSLGFGACLADDMGLGKTVQLLAFLAAMKTVPEKKTDKASLLILPASLISNWMSEIKAFYPHLKYYAAHPSAHRSGQVKPHTAEQLDGLDLVITTYALVQKYEWLRSYPWAYVILDEAQAIKNPGTKQARAVKKLTADNRIILTGTPIENRLGDLWSLFDFLNPGLLGTSKEFKAFAKNVNDDHRGYARLRTIISPYILRRLKTDKSVISDLPDKVEMKTYASLSKKQVVLYRGLVKELKRLLDDTEGIQRKGLVLSFLMKFKQICNHPDQYAGAGEYAEAHSGKFARLREICETVYAKREKVLVFTQFKEMTTPLSAFLAEIFEREGLVLHGGVPVGKRKKIIENFQNSGYIPFMILSLKAGGVGLNLTEANHVIHFDRWWNPAVENQATDRAFRIGQKKNVMVHKFLTQGTVEEKIDEMITEKTRMSDEIVAATGEKWITEMETDELMSLFQLTL